MKCCLVTICIGEKYLEQYNTLFRLSQEKYAKNAVMISKLLQII